MNLYKNYNELKDRINLSKSRGLKMVSYKGSIMSMAQAKLILKKERENINEKKKHIRVDPAYAVERLQSVFNNR